MLLYFVLTREGASPIDMNLSTTVILSAAKDLSPGRAQILRCAQDDRWGERGLPPSWFVRIQTPTGGGGIAGSLALMRRPMTLSFFASESMA